MGPSICAQRARWQPGARACLGTRPRRSSRCRHRSAPTKHLSTTSRDVCVLSGTPLVLVFAMVLGISIRVSTRAVADPKPLPLAAVRPRSPSCLMWERPQGIASGNAEVLSCGTLPPFSGRVNPLQAGLSRGSPGSRPGSPRWPDTCREEPETRSPPRRREREGRGEGTVRRGSIGSPRATSEDSIVSASVREARVRSAAAPTRVCAASPQAFAATTHPFICVCVGHGHRRAGPAWAICGLHSGRSGQDRGEGEHTDREPPRSCYPKILLLLRNLPEILNRVKSGACRTRVNSSEKLAGGELSVGDLDGDRGHAARALRPRADESQDVRPRRPHRLRSPQRAHPDGGNDDGRR